MLNYMKYIEHSEENLQFYLWFKSYETRFDQLSSSEKVLVPEWTQSQLDAEAHAARKSKASNPIATFVKDAFDAETPPTVSVQRVDPFNTPPKPSSFTDEAKEVDSDSNTSLSTDARSDVKLNAKQAFDDAEMHWQPCTRSLSNASAPGSLLLTDTSLYATIPRRDYENNRHVSCRGQPQRTEHLFTRATSGNARLTAHNAPICAETDCIDC
jgi:hypothetical protein